MKATDIVKFCEGGGMDVSFFNVVIAALENFDPEQNAIVASYDQLAKESGTSYSFVASAMKYLQDKGIIRPIKKGAWALRDRLFFPVNETVPGYENDEPIYFRVKKF